MTRHLTATLELPASRDALWQWHSRPSAFERLSPPWQSIEVVDRYDRLENGARLVMKVRKGPVPVRWVAVHEQVEPGHGFVDVQESGPFAHWRHEHRFEDVAGADDRARMIDRVAFRLPLEPVSDLFAGGTIERDLRAIFAYRQRTLFEDLALHRRLDERRGDDRPLRVAVTGSTGLVGSVLCAVLGTGGHEVIRIVRRRPETGDGDGDDSGDDSAATEVGWVDGAFVHRGETNPLESLDAFIDLAGENIASGPWSPRKKKAIRESREGRVRHVVDALGRLETPPRVYLCASAVGIYGDTGRSVVDARSAGSIDGGGDGALGDVDGFLADVARGWERAADGASAFAERVIKTRFGVVLSPEGGALEKLLQPQTFGFGVVPGSGEQLVSWIAVDDVVGAILHALASDLEGPIDVVAPRPVSMAHLVDVIGRVKRRPVPAKVPSALIELALGQMAKETVLASTGVAPVHLLDDGFVFRHDDLEDALRHLLGRTEGRSIGAITIEDGLSDDDTSGEVDA